MPNRALPVPRLQLLRLAYPEHLAFKLKVLLRNSEFVLRD